MPRRRRRRKVSFRFGQHYFKPVGIPLGALDEVVLSKEELETIRLKYLKNLQQRDGAKKMGISQSQFQRDMANTIKKIVTALIEGKAIKLTD